MFRSRNEPVEGEAKLMSEPKPSNWNYRTYLAVVLLIALTLAGFGTGSVVKSVQEQTGADLYLTLLSFFGPSSYEITYTDVTPFTTYTPSLKSTGNTIPGADVYDRRLELMKGFFPQSRFRGWSESVGRLDLLATHQKYDEKTKRWKAVRTIEPCTAIVVTSQLLLTANHCTKHTSRNSKESDLQIQQAHFWLRYFGPQCRGDMAESTPSNQPPCETPRCLVVYPTPVEQNEDLDFAVFRIQHACPGTTFDLADLKPASLQAAAAIPGQDLIVLHHPLGGVMFVTRSQCRVTVDEKSKLDLASFKHSCGTLPGTSGAPIMDEASGRVIALHVRGDRSIDSTAENTGLATPLAYVKKCTKTPALMEAIKLPEGNVDWYQKLEAPSGNCRPQPVPPPPVAIQQPA